ncbi:SDR family oxidoreductase [Halioxenophilus sp. WMMB6]|uniref:SDR family oxidoreductase n=1 Tax=Halioxenophilus sp. WMMB6 TaxID=3073815 RepID=UPI00295EE106|nr:SDR family oxidoreductase [Halioxenophilus sp. WMMB6]
MTDINNKTAVITGGGTGIGRGLALALAREGTTVAIADIMIANAQQVADEINGSGGRALALHCDVCDRASIRAMKQAVNTELGEVQLLFANAGATSFDPLVEMTDDDVDWIVQVNLMGVMNTIRAFLPDMIAAGIGHITATASMAGLLPGWVPQHVVYSAAKMGIIGLMMNRAMEINAHGIHTTTYCPGGVKSGMKERNGLYRPPQFGGPQPQAAVQVPEKSFKDNPLKFYTPEGVAPMVLAAVRNNRPFVFDHAEQRQAFRDTYSSVIEACFDDIERYEQEQGRPPLAED